MKVAFTLTQCAHSVPGGSAVAALELAAALRSAPTPTEIVAVGAARKNGGGNVSLPNPTVSYRLPYPLLYEKWNRSELGSVDRLVPDADAVHLTLALCPAKDRLPQVCTVHDMFPFTHPETLTARGAKVLQAGLHRVLERADLIATPSQASADELVTHGADADRVRVVPWGATPVEFSDIDLEQIRRRHGLPDRFVMFAGTVEPRKNLDVLLAAIELAQDDVHLVLVGPSGWGEVSTRVRGLAAERVRVLGSLERRDLLGAMTMASAVCMPSLAEGFGLPALEAMAQGTPVIHSATPALREVVGDAGPSVAVDDVAGWADEMSSFILDEARSAELGLVARERALPSTWERTAAIMRSVYEELT